MNRRPLLGSRAADTGRSDVSVRPLGERIIDDKADAAGRMVLLDGADRRVHVAAEGLRRALANVIRNALDYAGGGWVTIAGNDTMVVISVRDAGPGIPSADRARLLRPFERGDASRNRETGGAGLGLSIVAAFADQNAGTLGITDAGGGGTIVSLALPGA